MDGPRHDENVLGRSVYGLFFQGIVTFHAIVVTVKHETTVLVPFDPSFITKYVVNV
jgi:hypothetical protein